MNKNNICNNCGKTGHLFHQCKLPITSYGIILFRSSPVGIQYLMLRRKDSFGYIDFIRGKYMVNNIEQIQSIFNEMSISEKNKILKNDFETLWKMMWGETSICNQYKNEEILSQKKFDVLSTFGVPINEKKELCNFVMGNKEFYCLEDFIHNSTTRWDDPEWEFPKGRRNFQEKDLDCALREFEEETGIVKSDISIIKNVMAFEEIFVGSNHKSYKHKYFLAYTDKQIENLDNYQKSEVSKLDWKTLDECLESIRPYNTEKKKLIININRVLEEYRLY